MACPSLAPWVLGLCWDEGFKVRGSQAVDRGAPPYSPQLTLHPQLSREAGPFWCHPGASPRALPGKVSLAKPHQLLGARISLVLQKPTHWRSGEFPVGFAWALSELRCSEGASGARAVLLAWDPSPLPRGLKPSCTQPRLGLGLQGPGHVPPKVRPGLGMAPHHFQHILLIRASQKHIWLWGRGQAPPLCGRDFRVPQPKAPASGKSQWQLCKPCVPHTLCRLESFPNPDTHALILSVLCVQF